MVELYSKDWKTLVSRYGEGGLTLGRAIQAIGGSGQERHLKSFKKFFATHAAPGGKRSIEQANERIEGNFASHSRWEGYPHLSFYFT